MTSAVMAIDVWRHNSSKFAKIGEFRSKLIRTKRELQFIKWFCPFESSQVKLNKEKLSQVKQALSI